MSQVSEIIHDERRIDAVHLMNDPDQGCWKVRDKGQKQPWYCDSIESYGEPGGSDYVPWLKVIDDDEVIARLPAWAVEIRYAKPIPCLEACGQAQIEGELYGPYEHAPGCPNGCRQERATP